MGFSKSAMLSHFVDRVIERLVALNVEELSPERRDIEQRLHDPDRKKQPALSVRIIARNFRQISKRLGPLFKVQYGILHILAWRRPSKTLCFLLFYTALCVWPHLVFVFPLLTLLVAFIIPAFYYRHPMNSPSIIKVKKRGLNLFNFILDPEEDETRIIEDKWDEMEQEEQDELKNEFQKRKSNFKSRLNLDKVNLSSSENDMNYTQEDVPQGKEEFAEPQLPLASSSERSKIAKGVGLMMNMRDFQNLTSDVAHVLDKVNDNWQDAFRFRDEKLSTLVFYGVFGCTFFVLFFGQFIPWRAIFILLGWGGLIMCHPKMKKYVQQLQQAKARAKVDTKTLVAEKSDEPVESKDRLAYTRELLIVDDSPEIRYVEIWELQSKNELETEWKFACFSSNLFERKDPSRLKGRRPRGVDSLAKVHPPHGWKFDFGLANRWEIDLTPKNTLWERELDVTVFVERDTWLYDTPGSLKGGQVEIEYRRRRMIRECFRYARPLD